MEISIKTNKRNELVDITQKIMDIISKSNIKDGFCIVWCPHTTAGITINENADPDVKDDIIMGLNNIVSSSWPFKHAEGNSDAHIKSSMMGCEKTLIIENGDLILGTWQSVYFCEFDGPRNRNVIVKLVKS